MQCMNKQLWLLLRAALASVHVEVVFQPQPSATVAN